jgi:hypothetical protein
MEKVICPYCNQQAEYKSTKEFYGRDYGGGVYCCAPCQAYVGTHKATGKPLGTLADRKTREWRLLAHARFDLLWKDGVMSRSDAYQWMQEAMGMTKEEAHIGNFGVEECERLVKELHYRGIQVEANRGRHV